MYTMYINHTQIAKSASGAIIKLRCNTSCKTTNVVYLITCTECGKQSVGETGDHVNQRMNGHRDDWKHKITPTQIAKSGAIIKLSCNTSCKTTNVVYLITCTKCGKQYVGETGDHVNQRMNGHRDDWKHKRFETSPVAEHFCSLEHDFLNHTTLCCLDHYPVWTDRTRKARESYWIRRLNTLRPYGINKQLGNILIYGDNLPIGRNLHIGCISSAKLTKKMSPDRQNFSRFGD